MNIKVKFVVYWDVIKFLEKLTKYYIVLIFDNMLYVILIRYYSDKDILDNIKNFFNKKYVLSYQKNSYHIDNFDDVYLYNDVYLYDLRHRGCYVSNIILKGVIRNKLF